MYILSSVELWLILHKYVHLDKISCYRHYNLAVNELDDRAFDVTQKEIEC